MAISSATDFSRSREVQFLNREESRFPHLLRLSLDFSFQVLEVVPTAKTEKHFVLVTDDYRSTELESITPPFSTLAELNGYVGENMIDILHNYLFGFVEEDIQMAKSFA